MLVSDLAGRSNIVMKAQELGFKLTNDTPELKTILDAHQGTGERGLRIRGRRGSLALLIRETLEHNANCPSRWTATTSPCAATRSESVCEATVKVRVGDEVARTPWPKATAR